MATRTMDEQVDEEEVTPVHAAEFLDPLTVEESKEADELLDEDRKPNQSENSCPAVHLQIEPKQEGSSVSELRAPASVLSQCSSSSIQLNLSRVKCHNRRRVLIRDTFVQVCVDEEAITQFFLRKGYCPSYGI